MSRTLSVSDYTPQNIKQVSGHLGSFLWKFSGAFKHLKELRTIKGRHSIFTIELESPGLRNDESVPDQKPL